jgi:N-terminal PilZ-like domain PilZN1/PilZ domain
MRAVASAYPRFFKEGRQAKIGIKLADSKFLDVSGLVRSVEGDRLTLELVGNEPAGDLTAEPGADVLVSLFTDWSLCRCNAVLVQKICGRRIFLRLTGPVVEKQTREHFRLDVTIPLSYTIPEKQLLTDVHAEWAANRELLQEAAPPLMVTCPEGFKVAGWEGQDEIAPLRVNLSGGGLKFKTPEYLNQDSLVAINLFLPLRPPRVIPVVAETLRCSEIVLGRGKGNCYMTALRFRFINEKDRETIIAFIFTEQRRHLRALVDKRL